MMKMKYQKTAQHQICVLITPDKNEQRLDSTSILIRNDKSKNFEKGKRVRVKFKGNVTKSYPQNVDLVSIEILD